MDCSLPISSVHGILQGRILEWVTMSFSRGSSRPRYQTPRSPALQADSLPTEPLGNPRSQRWLGEIAPTLWKRSVTTTAPLALTGTSISQALGSVNDSCPWDMSWGINCKNKFQTQPAFKIPTNFFIYGKSRIQTMVYLIIKSFHYLILRYLRDQNKWRWRKWLLISWLRIMFQ